MTVFKFRSDSIDPDAVDRIAERYGYDSRAEYLRSLVREDAQRKNEPLTAADTHEEG